ncbi:restriction endonuclease [Moraxella caviae]|uniref:Restriction endonuclease n=1 Tax=Moraxella caviae TaxID=34060 RepID=A0A1T0A327_9GAMM|nr:Uma2 family endonuclease [Moraxella caviae]OOR90095.1 restriction endonuclease [Moraxella caviae]STZ14715.1 Uncharacterized protein conserved in cyanobacteria [Moraxella caviae]VEW11432.1 Uncharacterized protein conserved in cyanobacteria [Moraxella caviae]VEW14058.1 Uncharacterized protein conserved in cyanobacteria [Moraxella caviae]
MTAITSLAQLDMSKTYSYADYMLWQLNERVELIKGKILAMSPAPTRFHQDVSGNLFLTFRTFLHNHPCKVYTAPFDVRLPIPTKGKADTVVQPDLCVICDKSKLDDAGCNGAPELVIEILSKGNSKREMNIKFELYQEAGVLEYWIVDPANFSVLVYTLQDGKFITGRPFTEGDIVKSPLFPELRIAVDDIFAE